MIYGLLVILIISATDSGQTSNNYRPVQSKIAVSITPSPVRDMMKVTVFGFRANENLLLEIAGLGGMIVCHKEFRSTGPTTVRMIRRPAAPAGIYYYKIIRRRNGQTIRGRLVFQ